jgi:MSHA biogenesis protein MshN
MSVINKMLRDLDQQQQQKSKNAAVAGFRPPQKSYALLWLAIPLALLAGWLAQSWYNQQQSATSTSAAQPQIVQPQQTQPAPSAMDLVPKVAELVKQNNEAAEIRSLQDAAAGKVPADVTARLQGSTNSGPASLQNAQQVQNAAAKPADTAPALQPFAGQTTELSATEKTVVLAPEQDSTLQYEDATQQELVQVETYAAEDEAGLMQPEQDWQEPQTAPAAPIVAQDKPRSLAIEKVQLTPEQQLELWQEKAAKAEAVGNIQQAISDWQQIRQNYSNTVRPYLELSRLWQIQRNDAAAMQVLEQASAAGVQDAKLSMAQAALALKQQNWAQALTYLQYEPDIFTYSDFYAMKAAALQKTGQHAQAVQVFQQLARQHPDQARWWLGMALSYDALQQQQQALVAYRQALVSGSALSVASVDYVKKRISALE